MIDTNPDLRNEVNWTLNKIFVNLNLRNLKFEN
ncbi:MAG: hypothetical protein HW421_2046 [Ignavibacteria bacterium]|nr:hypothetical protein [Ignavibacteria bacterium]